MCEQSTRSNHEHVASTNPASEGSLGFRFRSLEKQQDHAAHHSDVCDIESRPVVLAEMKIEKISDGTPPYSIGILPSAPPIIRPIAAPPSLVRVRQSQTDRSVTSANPTTASPHHGSPVKKAKAHASIAREQEIEDRQDFDALLRPGKKGDRSALAYLIDDVHCYGTR